MSPCWQSRNVPFARAFWEPHVILPVPVKRRRHFLLAEGLENTGDREGAIVQLEQSARLDPNSALPHGALAELYGRNGRWDQAAAELRQAIRLSPQSAHFHYYLAGALLHIPQAKGDAMAELRQALKLDPDSEGARLRLQQLGISP